MGKFTEFKLPLKSLAAGVHEFAYHLDKQFFVNMDSADIRDADLDVRLQVTYAHDVYDLAFAVTGNMTLLCDRCLDDLVLPVETSYHVVVKYGDDYDESDELLQIPESDNSLNVAYMIYDTASLAIPLKHVHPQGQCNRQMSALLKKHRVSEAGDEEAAMDCAEFADDWSDSSEDREAGGTDPRWDALKKLSGTGQPQD